MSRPAHDHEREGSAYLRYPATAAQSRWPHTHQPASTSSGSRALHGAGTRPGPLQRISGSTGRTHARRRREAGAMRMTASEGAVRLRFEGVGAGGVGVQGAKGPGRPGEWRARWRRGGRERAAAEKQESRLPAKRGSSSRSRPPNRHWPQAGALGPGSPPIQTPRGLRFGPRPNRLLRKHFASNRSGTPYTSCVVPNMGGRG